MKIFLTFLVFLASLTSVTAQPQKAPKQVLLARFEVTRGAFNVQPPPPRRALMLYSDGRDIESVRINGKDKQVGGLGTFDSIRLMRRLEKLDLPKIDYQKYFDGLAKRPPTKGKEYARTRDGQEVEVEMRIKGTTVRFKMWNPDTFFYNHDDDKIANAVNAAIEAIVLTLGKSTVYF